jgi:hypothetical protein
LKREKTNIREKTLSLKKKAFIPALDKKDLSDITVPPQFNTFN